MADARDAFTVLCFGDSNTWGYNPADASRYSATERWAGVLRRELEGGAKTFTIVEGGQNSRTSVFRDPVEGRHKCGKDSILTTVEMAQPVDLVVIMLGTNDWKHRCAYVLRTLFSSCLVADRASPLF
jgi:lysophospholipase L1-like esterase